MSTLPTHVEPKLLSCDCVSKVNAQLAEKGGQLTMALGITSDMNVIGRLLLVTEKTGSKRKPLPRVTATFCPFCGVKVSP